MSRPSRRPSIAALLLSCATSTDARAGSGRVEPCRAARPPVGVPAAKAEAELAPAETEQIAEAATELHSAVDPELQSEVEVVG